MKVFSIQSYKGIGIFRRIYRFIKLGLGAVILLLLCPIKPFLKIRLGLLNYTRIGHLAVNTEYWLRTEFQRKQQGEMFIFVSSSKPANHQLVAMFRRKVPVITSYILYGILEMTKNRWPNLPVWLNLRSSGTHDYRLWSNSKSQLSFTNEEMRKGKKILRNMGIPDDAPYVCFAIRDRAYLNNKTDGNRDWRYHDYRDASIENCRLMAEWLDSQGIWVLRMGAVVEKPFQSDNPRIIDYASRYRSDFGDIFLLGHCKFFVGDTAGIFGVAEILDVPVALTNLVPITHLYPVPGSMVMPKKYRRASDKRLLPYREVVESGMGGYLHSHQYEAAGIEPVENTPEEILGLAQEMNARVDGTWVSTPEDEELHARFYSVFPPGHPSHGCPARVPVDFLRRNRGLLE